MHISKRYRKWGHEEFHVLLVLWRDRVKDTDTFLPSPLASTASACEGPTTCVLGAVVDDRLQDVQPGPEVGPGGWGGADLKKGCYGTSPSVSAVDDENRANDWGEQMKLIAWNVHFSK